MKIDGKIWVNVWKIGFNIPFPHSGRLYRRLYSQYRNTCRPYSKPPFWFSKVVFHNFADWCLFPLSFFLVLPGHLICSFLSCLLSSNLDLTIRSSLNESNSPDGLFLFSLIQAIAFRSVHSLIRFLLEKCQHLIFFG